MTDIMSSLTVSMITDSAGEFFTTFAPYIELLLGVLLAFVVISYLIKAIINKDENKK